MNNISIIATLLSQLVELSWDVNDYDKLDSNLPAEMRYLYLIHLILRNYRDQPYPPGKTAITKKLIFNVSGH